MNSQSNTPAIKWLVSDLHDALQQVPMESNYLDKLALYSKILTEDYNWRRVEIYSTHEQLDALATGARVTTSENALAVKHDTGWVIVTREGYTFSHNPSNKLALPVFSIPDNIVKSANDVAIKDSTMNGTQIT